MPPTNNVKNPGRTTTARSDHSGLCLLCLSQPPGFRPSPLDVLRGLLAVCLPALGSVDAIEADAYLPPLLGQDRDHVSVLDTDHLARPCPSECWEQEQGEKEDGCLGFGHWAANDANHRRQKSRAPKERRFLASE
jgi:hypothetical protein